MEKSQFLDNDLREKNTSQHGQGGQVPVPPQAQILTWFRF